MGNFPWAIIPQSVILTSTVRELSQGKRYLNILQAFSRPLHRRMPEASWVHTCSGAGRRRKRCPPCPAGKRQGWCWLNCCRAAQFPGPGRTYQPHGYTGKGESGIRVPRYKGTILFVSHDRYFIRQIADAVLIFENQAVMYYPFGYEHYLERKKKQEREPPSGSD